MKYHGRKAVIEIGPTFSPLSNICSFNSWALSFATDKIDVTSFCDNNKVKLLGLRDATGTFEGFFETDDIAGLWAAANATTSSWVRVTPSRDLTGWYFEGPAWLTVDSVSGSTTDAVKVSLSFEADGDWSFIQGSTP